MLLHRVWDPKLAQASYLIGCIEAKEALVIDANRDVDQYLALAASLGLRVAHVTETHIHADFCSGSRELAARARARLYLSDEGGDGWRYAFARSDGAVLLHDGDRFQMGQVAAQSLHFEGRCRHLSSGPEPQRVDGAVGHRGDKTRVRRALQRRLRAGVRLVIPKEPPDRLQLTKGPGGVDFDRHWFRGKKPVTGEG